MGWSPIGKYYQINSQINFAEWFGYGKCVSKKNTPKYLTKEQNDNWKDICLDIMERLVEEPDYLRNVIACDETWIFSVKPRNVSPIHAQADNHIGNWLRQNWMWCSSFFSILSVL